MPRYQEIEWEKLDADQRLDAWLVARRLTRAKLADLLDVNKSTLTRVVAGSRTSAPLVARIRELTGVDLERKAGA